MFTETQKASPAGALIKTTLVDYPSRVASSLFLTGCNLRCPYCYNGPLVFATESKENLATLSEVLAHLEKRRNVLSGFVISGGEALLNPLTKDLIRYAKSLGYQVKLDTNGTLPEKLEELLSDRDTTPDFVAMDIKTSPSRYASLIAPHADKDASFWEENLRSCIRILSGRYKSSEREWRTVLVPPLVSKDDIRAIAELLPEDASWQFAQFRNENCLDPSYNAILPYSDKEAQELVEFARTMRKGAALR